MANPGPRKVRDQQASATESGAKIGLDVAILDGAGGQVTTFGGGSQYTEGDTDSSITGTAVMWEDGSDTLRSVSAAKPLPVNIISGGSSVAVTTSTLANVASSASSVTLQASNASRVGWDCFNDSTQVLYVKFGATASATSFTVKIAAGGYYEMPSALIYKGIIDGIWASANGAARVTELT